MQVARYSDSGQSALDAQQPHLDWFTEPQAKIEVFYLRSYNPEHNPNATVEERATNREIALKNAEAIAQNILTILMKQRRFLSCFDIFPPRFQWLHPMI